MHGFPEIDGVEHLDGVAAPLKHPSALHQDRPLRVGDAVARVHLHQVRLHEKPGLARSGTADYQHILVAGKLWVFWAAVHGEPLRLGQDDVLLRVGILIGSDIRGRPPAGRAVLCPLPEFLCLLLFQVEQSCQKEDQRRTEKHVRRVQAWPGRSKGNPGLRQQPQQPLARISSCQAPVQPGELVRRVPDREEG